MISKLKPQSEFARNVLTLMTGTMIAQVLPIAVSPILTRVYSPQEFGVMAFYMAVSGVISIVATARYELAIVLPKSEECAINVVALSMVITAGMSLFVLLFFLSFSSYIVRFFGKPEISHLLYFLPFSILFNGVYQSLNYWANRKKQYRRMATSRVIQSIGGAGMQLTIGLSGGLGSSGLIIGSLTGQILATLLLARLTFREDRSLLNLITSSKVKEMALQYINHPKYLIITHGISAVYEQIPVLFISKFFSLADAGHFTLAFRMVNMPSALIANSVGDVFRQRATEDFHKYGRFDEVFKKTVTKIAFLGLPFFFIFFFFAEDIITLVFSEKWKFAGQYAKILAVSAYFGFVFTPIDKSALIRNKINYMFGLHLFRLTTYSLASFLSWSFHLNISDFLILITLCNIIFYCAEGGLFYRLSKCL